MSTHPAVGDSDLSQQERSRILSILKSNWRAEMRGQKTYAALAEREKNPQRSQAFRFLADAEQKHADMWSDRYHALGGGRLSYNGSKTGEADTLTNRIAGVDMALRRLELDESRDTARYAKQVEEIGDEPTVAILRRVLKDEREHYGILNNLIRNSRPPAPFSADQARKELSDLLVARQAGSPQVAGWIGDGLY